MTRRAWIVALLVALVAILFVCIGYLWHRGRVDPLPPAVRTAVTNERADRARLDSSLVAATREAEAAQRRQEAATARADSLESVAHSLGRYADRLAVEAALARSSADSAARYHAAYDARTVERDTLLVALAGKDDALRAAEARAVALTRADTLANHGRQRADSVLDAVVASVAVCTVPGTFGRLRCPPRRVALFAGIAAGLAGPRVYRLAHSR